MNTTTSSYRRIAAIAGAATITCITAVTTTTSAAQPAPATNEPERPCFIVQPRWNTALDGPVPTCPTPTWVRSATPSGSTGTDTRHRLHFGDELAADPGY